jgi:CheY-like chemotaxis protein
MAQMNAESIMVIGVDSHFCYLMRRYVRESAHPLLYANPGEKALELVLREKPALIVLEAGQPEAKGWQMLKSLKASLPGSQIPVAFCSWDDHQEGEFTDDSVIYLRMPILYEDFLKVLAGAGIQCPGKNVENAQT